MKQFLFFSLLTLLLFGCSLAESAQDTTAGIGLNRANDTPDIVSRVSDFNCEGMTIPGTTQAQISFTFETNDSQYSVSGATVGGVVTTVYGSGVANLSESADPFKAAQRFECAGRGEIRAFRLPDEQSTADWWVELPGAQLTAQIDGIVAQMPVDRIVGVANVNAQKSSIVFEHIEVTYPLELAEFTCVGKPIPDSNLASMTYTARATDGRLLIGAGIGLMEGADKSGPFQCRIKENGLIVYDDLTKGVTNVMTFNLPNLIVEFQDGGELNLQDIPVTGIMFET